MAGTNTISTKGGPHPQAYHEEVYERLDRATSTCRTLQQCQQALTAELQRLAREISTQGSRLNKLVTRTE
ncbi:MAG: AHH domain-containing protein [Hyalangium sp.]|uniref:AHH domain-containing protein n=1 Tax=Hyalangium sp. TaxID=2028555 RepID=UPI00389AC5D3